MTRTYILPNGELKDTKKYSAIVYDNEKNSLDILSKFNNLDILQRGVIVTSLFDRKIIDDNGIRFKPEMIVNEDMYFKYEYMLFCNDIICMPCCGYHYVYYPNSLANSKKETTQLILLYSMKFYKEQELLKKIKYNKEFDKFSKKSYLIGSFYAIVSSTKLSFFSKLKETKKVLSYFCGVFSYVLSPFVLVMLITYKKRNTLFNKK